MQWVDRHDFWETTVDDLEAIRWTAASGGATLVRLRLTNKSPETIVTRVVEEVPASVTNAVLITTTSDTPDSWRRTRDHVVHEFVVPSKGKRTTAYLLRSDDDPPVALEPPTVESVRHVPNGDMASVSEYLEPLEDGSEIEDEPTVRRFPRRTVKNGLWGSQTVPKHRDGSRSGGTTGAACRPSASTMMSSEPQEGEERPEESTDESTEHESDPAVGASDAVAASAEEPPGEEARSSGWKSDDDGEPTAATLDESAADQADSVVDRLIVALEEDATPAQRRALRSKLGASESERARLKHVQGRLDDFAAYVDVLESLIDQHGIDVLDELRDSVEANASATAALEDELSAVSATVESHRESTDDVLDALESELAETRSELAERLGAVESTLEATRSDFRELEADVESDRQARAREVRRFDESLSELDDALDRLQADVRENEAFRRRFTAAFSSSTTRPGEDEESATGVEYEPTSTTD